MISFRPIVLPSDTGLLMRIYRSTREQELDKTGWNEVEKSGFIRLQFDAQHTHYQKHYPDCEYLIILEKGVPIGRLYIDTRPDCLHIIDIALLCEHRNRGLGSAIMNAIITDAERLGRKVGIYVEERNPAMRLYQRLGFRKIEHQGLYFLMHLAPQNEALGGEETCWRHARIQL